MAGCDQAEAPRQLTPALSVQLATTRIVQQLPPLESPSVETASEQEPRSATTETQTTGTAEAARAP